MDELKLSTAILKLRPNSTFTFVNGDYSTIQWKNLNGNPPTQAEIDDAIEQIKADEIAAETKMTSAKASAQAKLEALGLTVNEIKALGF